MSAEAAVMDSPLASPWPPPELVVLDPPDEVGRRSADRTLRIAIVDDDVLLRTGLASVLERPGQSVVGVAGDPAGLLDLVDEHDPDLVIVDLQMPSAHAADGLRAAERLRVERPEIGIMVLSGHVEVEHAATLLGTGHGIGYLLKGRVVDMEDFFDSLRRVARGGCVLDPALVHQLMATRHRDDPLAVLSKRELDVLALMAAGRSNLGIANELWVAEGTVEKHVRSILTKLDLGDSPTDHRRVLAVIAYLRTRSDERPVDPEP